MKGGVFMKTFLLSGAHGVGKGYLLKRIENKIGNYTILSASALISKYKCATDAGYKKVMHVNKNQDVLISALNQEQFSTSQDIILDGHICIYNADGLIERIPEYFFIEGQISGIIILQDSEEEIFNRINQRDSKSINIEDIIKMQNEEQKYAEEIEKKYLIKHKIISHEYSGEQFELVLKELGGDIIE